MAVTVVADTAEAEVVEDTAVAEVAEARVTAEEAGIAVEALPHRVVEVVPVQAEAEAMEW